jgi:hypothetical protein
VDRRTIVNVVAIIAFVVGVSNYGIWLKESLDLGGNALSGEVRDGHYYVANKGRYVEVAPDVWEHSRVHTLSIFVTQPLMLIGLGYLVWTAARKRSRGT